MLNGVLGTPKEGPIAGRKRKKTKATTPDSGVHRRKKKAPASICLRRRLQRRIARVQQRRHPRLLWSLLPPKVSTVPRVHLDRELGVPVDLLDAEPELGAWEPEPASICLRRRLQRRIARVQQRRHPRLLWSLLPPKVSTVPRVHLDRELGVPVDLLDAEPEPASICLRRRLQRRIARVQQRRHPRLLWSLLPPKVSTVPRVHLDRELGVPVDLLDAEPEPASICLRRRLQRRIARVQQRRHPRLLWSLLSRRRSAQCLGCVDLLDAESELGAWEPEPAREPSPSSETGDNYVSQTELRERAFYVQSLEAHVAKKPRLRWKDESQRGGTSVVSSVKNTVVHQASLPLVWCTVGGLHDEGEDVDTEENAMRFNAALVSKAEARSSTPCGPQRLLRVESVRQSLPVPMETGKTFASRYGADALYRLQRAITEKCPDIANKSIRKGGTTGKRWRCSTAMFPSTFVMMASIAGMSSASRTAPHRTDRTGAVRGAVRTGAPHRTGSPPTLVRLGGSTPYRVGVGMAAATDSLGNCSEDTLATTPCGHVYHFKRRGWGMAAATDSLGNCSVCLSGLLLAGGEDTLATTPCGHVYHFKCILQCLEYKKSCPNCCTALSDSCLHKIAPAYIGGKVLESAGKRKKATGKGGGDDDDDASSEDYDPSSLLRRLRASQSHAEFLAKEVKKLEASVETHRQQARCAKKKVTELRGSAEGSQRDQAALWERNRQLERENQKLSDTVTAAGYQEQVASQGFDKIAADIMAADPSIKNHFICDLHALLEKEKERTKAAAKTISEQADALEDLRQKAAKYKELSRKLRRQQQLQQPPPQQPDSSCSKEKGPPSSLGSPAALPSAGSTQSFAASFSQGSDAKDELGLPVDNMHETMARVNSRKRPAVMLDELPPSVDVEEVLATQAQGRNVARKVSVMQTAGLSPMSVPRPIKLVDTPPHTRPRMMAQSRLRFMPSDTAATLRLAQR
ncbi:hypothetical protein DIPPA_03888 [Diplonema papillatum]|nr:hypothetical protein DIPPA_03888 [Diplonema papillatum]